MRRILHVNRVGFMGGVERVMLTLSDGLQPLGYQSVIACPAGGMLTIEAERRGIEVVPTELNRFRISMNPLVMLRYPQHLLNGWRAVNRVARQQAPDILHLHHPVSVLYAERAIRALGVTSLLHVHEIGPAKPLYALALRRAVRVVDGIVCVSEAARQLARDAGADERKMQVVHNGLDPSLLTQLRCARAAEVTGVGPHIGVFGVIEPRKGQDVFLRAAAHLTRAFPDARFWLVGSLALKDKAGFERRLHRMIDDLNLEDRVVFAGHQPNVAAWMRAMDVVVLPSVAHESFGMVLAEAQALGRPVVAAAVGGTPEVVRDGVTGFLAPPYDDIALARAIERALGVDARFVANASEDSLRRFSPATFRQKVAHIYDELLDRRGRRVHEVVHASL